jgi:sugar lactone lactonase YvrE
MRTITPTIELALDAKNHLGETPVWSQEESALYWVNCEEPPELLRWNPKSGELKRWAMPERIGGLVLKKGGGALVVLARGLHDFDFATGTRTMRVPSPLPEGVSLHECKCDPSGRFWVGSINEAIGPGNMSPGGASFFRLDGDTLTPVIENISCANGLAFSPDGRALYFSDSTTGRCDRWDVDPATGAISNGRPFFTLAEGEGFVDGAAMDSEGGYWPAIVYAGWLRRYLPDGTLDVSVKLPFLNPTMSTFGGDDLETLYITTLSEGEPGRDGGLFAFKPGVRGAPTSLFSG